MHPRRLIGIRQTLFLWLMTRNLQTSHSKQHVVWKKWITNRLQSLERR
jgi:hypothetical protein